MTTSQRYTKLQNKTVSKEGRKIIFLDKNDLTKIYRHNRSPKTLFLAFLFFLIMYIGCGLNSYMYF